MEKEQKWQDLHEDSKVQIRNYIGTMLHSANNELSVGILTQILKDLSEQISSVEQKLDKLLDCRDKLS